MEYFLMEQDDRYAYYPQLKNVFNRLDRRQIYTGGGAGLPETMLFKIVSHPQTKYPDLLDKQLFLVSAGLHQLLRQYEPDLLMKNIALVDEPQGRVTNYWLPIFTTRDCLGPGSEFNLDRSILKKISLKTAALPQESIFKLAGVGHPYVIVRLDLAESILRRDLHGLRLTHLAQE